jgi:hypothetical protein
VIIEFIKDHVINFLRHDDASVRRAAVSTCSSLMIGPSQSPLSAPPTMPHLSAHNSVTYAYTNARETREETAILEASSSHSSSVIVSGIATTNNNGANSTASPEQQKKRRRGYLASVRKIFFYVFIIIYYYLNFVSSVLFLLTSIDSVSRSRSLTL